MYSNLVVESIAAHLEGAVVAGRADARDGDAGADRQIVAVLVVVIVTVLSVSVAPVVDEAAMWTSAGPGGADVVDDAFAGERIGRRVLERVRSSHGGHVLGVGTEEDVQARRPSRRSSRPG